MGQKERRNITGEKVQDQGEQEGSVRGASEKEDS